MFIQLKDHTGKLHRVPAEGAIFGRDRSRCDVVLPDIGVSGVHAKIYCRAGRWFLEDLHSSNGTFVGEDRVDGPVELTAGLAFGLFRWRFEVTDIDTTPDEKSGPSDAGSNKTASRLTARPSVPNQETAASRAEKNASKAETGVETRAVAKPKLVVAPAEAAQPEELAADVGGKTAPAPTAANDGDGTRAFTPANFVSGVKAALGYYLTAIPRLALQPLGFVRRSIQEPEHPAMAPVDLAAWTFVPMAIGVVATLLAGVVVSVIGHVFSFGQVLLTPIISLGVVLVSSIITGLIWHPVNGWLIRKLGGQSDATARSNMLVVLYTATPLCSIATAVGVLLTLVPLLFMSSVGYLLSVVAALITIFVVYSWYRHFNVAKWFLAALLVLGLAWAALGVLNVVRVTRVSIATLTSRTGAVATAPAEKKPAPQPTPSQVAADTANNARASGTSIAEVVVKPTEATPSKEVATAIVPPTPTPTPSKEPAVAEAATPSSTVPSVATAASTPTLTYAQFLMKRDAVEKAIEADPPVLTRAKGLLDLYKRMHAEMSRINDKYSKNKKPDANDVVNKRLHDAELYDATVGLVVQMEQMIRAESR